MKILCIILYWLLMIFLWKDYPPHRDILSPFEVVTVMGTFFGAILTVTIVIKEIMEGK